MGHESASYAIEFDSRLVEDAVMLSEDGLHPLARVRFRRERDLIYRLEDPEDRDRAFSVFHHGWFDRMEIGEPVARRIREHWDRISVTRRCLVMPASSPRDQDADLRTDAPIDSASDAELEERSSVLIRVCVTTLADRETLERFLDHELLHVTDMLDPSFGYRTELPAAEGGPARARRTQDRYRILWDCTIDGRLHRDGKLPATAAVRCRAEFERGFPELGSGADDEFRRWFEGPRPSHDELVRLARTEVSSEHSGICPLCRFPYAELSSPEDGPRGEVLEQIRTDFPAWLPEHGICVPCIGLYRARQVAL
jgi:hypothetical protein